MLVVTHKSILRALICTALGLPPERQVGPFLWLQFGVLCTLGLEKFVENITSCFTILPNLQDCKHFLFLLFF
jgi:broad specificity phosphatase PhoE